MKRKLACILIGVAFLAVAHASPCAAQQLWPRSFEFGTGVGFGQSSAPHGSSRGLSVDALVGFRPATRARRRERAAGGLVVGVGGTVNALGVAEACDIVPGGSCTPEFPEFWILSTLAGWETGRGRARILVGPAIARSSSHHVGATQVRLDLAQHVFSHVSLLASGQFDYIPKYKGDSFGLGSLGVGVRLR